MPQHMRLDVLLVAANYNYGRIGMQNVKTKPMTGSEIAGVLQVSRMAVSQTLKRALRKIYTMLKKRNKHLDSFEVAVMMSEILCVSLDDECEVNKFFNLFPANIKKEIERHAEKRIRNFNQAMC
jgi:DNA-binding transcriptional regulator GbsR (MarR family)